MNPYVCFNALIVINCSSCISPRISDQSSAIYSDSLHTDNNWNNLTAWKFISFSIQLNVTGQHDWQDERLTSQLSNQSGHFPLTGNYFESCKPLVSLTDEKKGITETKRKEFLAKVDHSILKEHFRVFLQLLKLHLPLQWSYHYLLSWKKIDSWFSRDVTKIQTTKLPIFMSYHCTQTPLFIQIFSSKESFVLQLRTLEFPGFCLTLHLACGWESSYVG